MSHTVDHKYFINFAKPNPTEFKRGLTTHPMEKPSAERAMANIGYVVWNRAIGLAFLLVNNKRFKIEQQTLDYPASSSLYTSHCCYQMYRNLFTTFCHQPQSFEAAGSINI